MSESEATEVPVLNRDALVAELRALHRSQHRSRDTALYARLAAELPEVEVELDGSAVPFRVHTARCELELRAAIVDIDRDPQAQPVVVLVDYEPQRLPADIFGRLATGAIRRVTGDRLLRAIFSNANVSRDVLRCRALCEALRGERDWTVAAPSGAMVTLDYAFRAWLVRRGVFEHEGETDLSLLARFASVPAPEALGRYLAERAALARELDVWIERAVHPLASLWLALWTRGQGTLAASVCFALDAVSPSLGREDYVDGAVRSQWDELCSSAGRKRVDPMHAAAMAERVATHLQGREGELRALLDEAQRWLPSHAKVSDVASSSRFLRSSFDRRRQELGGCLERAVDDPSATRVRDAAVALERLGAHHLRELDSGARESFDRARMAVRLLGWLDARRRAGGEESNPDVALQESAEEYVRSGAWADYARAVARSSEDDPLSAAVQRVVRAADLERDEDDQRFARALRTWVENGRAARERAVPIERALDRFAADFLADAGGGGRTPRRRLLVIVLDGMAWANCVELLESLGTAGYYKLRFAGQHTGRGALVPVIAALPTITEVSRSALLSGRLLAQGEERDSARDPARFAQHPRLSALGGEHKPKLLLKSALQTASGDASIEALELVESANPIVGVVINAIDDQLKAGRQLRTSCDLSNIRPLRALLDRATLAQRAVLLVADHGHVAGSRMTRTQLARSEDGGSRWRAVRERVHGTQSELTLSPPFAWAPRGFSHVAMLVGETDTNGMVPGAGEHGGASMAEVIAPAVLIGSETLAERVRIAQEDEQLDRELEVAATERPSWWSIERATSANSKSVDAPTRPRASSKPAAPTAQLELAGVVEKKAEPRVMIAPDAPSSWGATLQRSKALAAIGVTKVDPKWVAVIDALASASEPGKLSPDRVALAAGVLSSRVEGLVARIAEVLNADGTPVLRYDAAQRLVLLDLVSFKEIFGA